jgi:hypothetical protein
MRAPGGQVFWLHETEVTWQADPPPAAKLAF